MDSDRRDELLIQNGRSITGLCPKKSIFSKHPSHIFDGRDIALVTVVTLPTPVILKSICHTVEGSIDNHLWRRSDIRLPIKGRIHKAAVMSVLLCGSES